MPDTAPEPTGPRRRALVTGASSGIGEAFAQRLARDKYDLVLVARSREALEALAMTLSEKRGVQVETLVADLTQADDLRRVEARVVAEPGVELLVNNAGVGSQGSFAASDADKEEEQILLNVLALSRLTRAAVGSMVPRGHGAVVNVSSLAGLAPMPFSATYGGTKAFVNSFSEALSEELRGSGVRVQALCPGFTRTNFQTRAGIDPGTVPDFAWMTPEAVVDASLDALEKGSVICIPGAGYKALAAVTGALPRSWYRRALGAFQGHRSAD